MSRTWAVAVAAILFYPLGLLAVAVGMTVPFMVREFRLTRIEGSMASLAEQRVGQTSVGSASPTRPGAS